MQMTTTNAKLFYFDWFVAFASLYPHKEMDDWMDGSLSSIRKGKRIRLE